MLKIRAGIIEIIKVIKPITAEVIKEVSSVTLSATIPERKEEKIKLIRNERGGLTPIKTRIRVKTKPTKKRVKTPRKTPNGLT